MRLSAWQRQELEEIYDLLQKEYERAAAELDFSCTGCDDNCCDSYFRHHTYIEWCYFREGLEELSDERREEVTMRAEKYLTACKEAEAAGRRPQIPCPLLECGRCSLYKHRLLVCRTHGVPAVIVRPDSKRLQFPGCFRCQERVEQVRTKAASASASTPFVNRTPFLIRLAKLEDELLQGKRTLLPKVKLTIAEMIVQKPPNFFA